MFCNIWYFVNIFTNQSQIKLFCYICYLIKLIKSKSKFLSFKMFINYQQLKNIFKSIISMFGRLKKTLQSFGRKIWKRQSSNDKNTNFWFEFKRYKTTLWLFIYIYIFSFRITPHYKSRLRRIRITQKNVKCSRLPYKIDPD